MQRLISMLKAQSGCGQAVIRLVTGVILFVAGYQKVFVNGLGAVTGYFEKIGVFLPQITGPFIGLLELIGGALFFVGLFSRYLGIVFAIEFVVAIWAKLGPMDAGFAGARIDMMILAASVYLATNGAGKFSLDALLRRGDA